MKSSPGDLVRFLLARFDEEDDHLRQEHRAQARNGATQAVRDIDRRRVECASRRQLVGLTQQLLVLRDLPAEKPVRDLATDILRALAMPYEEHNSFRTEWSVRR